MHILHGWRNHPPLVGFYRVLFWILVAISFFWVLSMAVAVADALAQDGGDTPAGDGLEIQIWAIVAGALMPLGGYVLNKLAPWVSEQVKGFVQVILAAIGGALAELIELGSVGFDSNTLEYVVAAVSAALFTHGFLYTKTGVNQRLGASPPVEALPPGTISAQARVEAQRVAQRIETKLDGRDVAGVVRKDR